MTEEKRKHGSNFSESEKQSLVNIVIDYKNIIENKKTDSICSKEKDECWIKISKIFNASSSSTTPRDVKSLKSCWDNLKKKCRKYSVEQTAHLYKTGGGSYKENKDPVLDKVSSVLKSSIKGLYNPYDNDQIDPGTEETVDDSQQEIHQSFEEDRDVLEYLNIQRLKSPMLWNIDSNEDHNNNEYNVQLKDIPSTSKDNTILSNNEHLNNMESDIEETQNRPKLSAIRVLKNKLSRPLRRGKITKPKNKIQQFENLAESKIQLVNLMKEDLLKKQNVELDILRIKLEKETTELKIMEKQLEIKALILDKFKNGDVHNNCDI
ncbi:fibrinogen silencer-binding protein-like [Prorops nasuta]|uniref:fibrinogen silencer-binding protein-like n=1 Tax=Prorops nasuta TaxID=863751 RepID=UPI0034CE21CA